MRKTKLIILILLLNSSIIYSNNVTSLDSIKNVIENSVDTIKFDAYIETAKIYYYNADYYKSINNINKALIIPDLDVVRIARANNFLGLVYYHIGDHPTALKYHLISLELREEYGDDNLTAVAYNSIAVVYTALNNPKKSNYYLQKALVVEKNNNNTENIAMIYNNISNNYSLENKNRKALEFLLKSDAIIDDTNLDKALLLINIGYQYTILDSIENAKNYYFTAIDYCKKTDNEYYLALAYRYIGDLSLTIKEYKQSLFFFNSALNISERIKANEISKESYAGLINVYSVKNITDSLIKYNNLYYSINDSIFNSKTADKIAELQIKYEFDKKIKEIDNLKIKNELADRNQKIFIAFFILLSLVIIIIILIIFNQRRKILADKFSIEQNLKLIKYEDVIDNSIDEIVETKPIEQPKDTNSTLSEEFKTMLEVSISKKIRKEKLYLNSDFSLNELAKILDTNRRYVSQVINERFEQNFSSFINQFRIKEAMRLMSNPDYDKYTIDSISKKVGFNSISAFNGAFKKHTGVTPSTFVKSIKK